MTDLDQRKREIRERLRTVMDEDDPDFEATVADLARAPRAADLEPDQLAQLRRLFMSEGP